MTHVTDYARRETSPHATRLDLADAELATELGGRVYYPHHVRVEDPDADFSVRLSTRTFGPLTVGLLQYGAHSTVRTAGALETGYEINAPRHGTLLHDNGRSRLELTPGSAAVLGPPDVDVITGWAEPQQLVAVKIEAEALESTLERLLGHRIDGPILFDHALSLSSGRGRELWSCLGILVDQLHEQVQDQLLDTYAGGSSEEVGGSSEAVGGSLFDASPFAVSLAQSVLTGLLYAQQHNHCAALHGPVPAAGSRAIREAVAYVDGHAAEPLGVADVAERVGLSVRALQQGFATHLGLTPTAYLRQVRLRLVHAALLDADAELTTVAAIASAHGFFHLGRFAAIYRDTFGEAPSVTLRRA